MTRFRFIFVMTAISCATATAPAQADAKETVSLWEGCGENKVSGVSKFMVGPTAARYLTPRATAAEGIARCAQELLALDAAAPWQRRAALLRSRAKFHVMANDPMAATADLDAIAAIEQPDAVYARSFAVSVHMLRAVAGLQAGQRDAAATEALAAMRLRPWSETVAQFAWLVCSMRDGMPAQERARWNNLVTLDSAFAERRALSLAQAGDWTGATVDWLRAMPAPGEIGQTYVTVPGVTVRGAPGVPVKGVDVRRSVDAIVTAAMAGRLDLADPWLVSLRASVKTPPVRDELAKQLGIVIDPAVQKAELEKSMALIEMARLAASGDFARAVALFDATPTMPVTAVSTAMLRSIAARIGAPADRALRQVLAKLDELAVTDRGERLARLLESGLLLDDLPAHEEVMLANPYRSAVKFLRANGASVKLAKDGRTATISFFGNKSQRFAIREMVLLRAAEVAIEQKQAAFRIVSSSDYVQTSTMTMNGTPVGPSTVSGNSVSMSIEFVESAAAGAVNAAEIRAALGPIYINEASGGKS